MLVVFFKQKTAYELRISDWSSDVCSSDLPVAAHPRRLAAQRADEGSARQAARPCARAGGCLMFVALCIWSALALSWRLAMPADASGRRWNIAHSLLHGVGIAAWAVAPAGPEPAICRA